MRSRECILYLKSVLIVIFIAALAFIISNMSAAQEPTKIKKVPAKENLEVSGKALYGEYCAVCHGQDGKGKGPAHAALKVLPPDLTQLALHNEGKFPFSRVQEALSRVAVPSHGSSEMPIWGPIFRRMSQNRDLGVLRSYNLTKYIESLQEKQK